MVNDLGGSRLRKHILASFRGFSRFLKRGPDPNLKTTKTRKTAMSMIWGGALPPSNSGAVSQHARISILFELAKAKCMRRPSTA